MRKTILRILVLVLGIISVNTHVHALDLSESYLSLFNSSTDKVVIENPGNLFKIHFTNDSGNSTTTIVSISEDRDIFIGNFLDNLDANNASVIIGNNSQINGATGITTVGSLALRLSTGSYNVAVGNNSGGSHGSGGGNVFFGNSTGLANNSTNATWNGDGNTILGVNAASGIDDSGDVGLSWNTIIGYDAGDQGNLSGDSNILIGARTYLPVSNGSNQLNLGNIFYGINISGIHFDISPGTSGIGTTTPLARFSIQANTGETNNELFIIASSTESENITLYSVNNVGHHIYGGVNPTISSCGSGPTNQGNDSRGRIIIGTGTVNSCTLTFANSWTNSPVCHITQESGTTTEILVTPSNTDIIITSIDSIDSNTFSYSCDGF
jgi:hypothetical protein